MHEDTVANPDGRRHTIEVHVAADDDTFPCLQSADTATLVASWQQAADTLTLTGGSNLYVPVIDGADGLIPDLPSKLFAAGKFSKIPFMAGTNLDEGVFLFYI